MATMDLVESNVNLWLGLWSNLATVWVCLRSRSDELRYLICVSFDMWLPSYLLWEVLTHSPLSYRWPVSFCIVYAIVSAWYECVCSDAHSVERTQQRCQNKSRQRDIREKSRVRTFLSLFFCVVCKSVCFCVLSVCLLTRVLETVTSGQPNCLM